MADEPVDLDAGSIRAGTLQAEMTLPTRTGWAISTPGVYELPSEVYHLDPVAAGSLSNSGVKLLLDCPARFDYRRRNPEYSKAFDFGGAAHRRVLGVGDEIVVVDAKDWRTKAAQAARDEARAAGKAPVLAHDMREIDGMADALREHAVAGQLFLPGQGVAERAHIWFDDEFGIWRRSMVDWKLYLPDGRVVIVDYKSTKKASIRSIQRSVYDFGYHLQDAFYSAGVEILDDTDAVDFLFVFQEKEPPYLVTVVQLTEAARQWGRLQIRKAMEVFVRCQQEGRWPGYADDIVSIDLPRWAEFDLQEAWQLPAEAAGSLQIVEEF